MYHPTASTGASPLVYFSTLFADVPFLQSSDQLSKGQCNSSKPTETRTHKCSNSTRCHHSTNRTTASREEFLVSETAIKRIRQKIEKREKFFRQTLQHVCRVWGEKEEATALR